MLPTRQDQMDQLVELYDQLARAQSQLLEGVRDDTITIRTAVQLSSPHLDRATHLRNILLNRPSAPQPGTADFSPPQRPSAS